jgi:SAM-dependent methyltransferase
MNGTLRRSGEWREADALVKAAGLPPYIHAPAKAWDALRACNFILAHLSREDPILDAGGLPEVSPIARWLARHGFHVDVINPELPDDFTDPDDDIRYLRGDATDSPFADCRFGAVTCLSVIEHGVPIDPFFTEMHRILRPGGYLIVSTDFWHEPIDARGRRCFGSPVRIFTPEALRGLIQRAASHGFQATGVVDYRCEEAVVQWLGLSYTFIDFALRKVA